MFTSTDNGFACKSKLFSEKSFKTPVTSGNIFDRIGTFFHDGRIGAKSKGICLMQNNISFTCRNVANVITVFELHTR